MVARAASVGLISAVSSVCFPRRHKCSNSDAIDAGTGSRTGGLIALRRAGLAGLADLGTYADQNAAFFILRPYFERAGERLQTAAEVNVPVESTFGSLPLGPLIDYLVFLWRRGTNRLAPAGSTAWSTPDRGLLVITDTSVQMWRPDVWNWRALALGTGHIPETSRSISRSRLARVERHRFPLLSRFELRFTDGSVAIREAASRLQRDDIMRTLDIRSS
jgi:hypothetical protein